MAKPQRSIEQILEATNRFTIRRRLGAGGMGVVYEAYDKQRDAVVALKTLRYVNPGSLYLFKQEFRALADVIHPNLVTLYELFVSEDQWFFTMELLTGMTVLAHLRGETPEPVATADPATPHTVTATSAARLVPHEPRTLPTLESPVVTPRPMDARTAEPVEPEIVRPVLMQLAEGLGALHASGHLHCDIKPSNLLVTPEGRLVVLDFGVITAMAGRGRQRGAVMFRGTPAYTSPEQARGDAPTPASDWYSVGVILYQALTGRRPFRGTATEMLELKQITDPPEPENLRAEVDPELASLCMRLLARDPADRPSGPDMLVELGYRSDNTAGEVSGDLAFEPGEAELALVGRDRELTGLREAFEQSRAGSGVVVRVKGRSGMGKTALVSCFLDGLSHREEALVLSGRCYERESVPHQAVDGLVDALCQYLLQLPRREAEMLMPVDVLAMARAFPVLGRVEAVTKARRRSTIAVTDPVELRRRAYAALKELFARIAERQPLVLFIDDLQWGDVDSAPFLSNLLARPAPPLLLLVSYRTEETASSALLQTLFDADAADDSSFVAAREIPIGRLSLPQARNLAVALLEAAHVATSSAETIARESGGNPFFVHELVRYVATQGAGSAVNAPPLAQVLLSRAAALSANARQLLVVVAVAGKPIPEAVARRAAEVGDQHIRAIAELRTAHLVRTTGRDGNLVIETYHDRIREVLAESLADDVLRTIHLRIAESIEACTVNDPEALALHYANAGEPEAAAGFATQAADKAADALAFDRASAFYGLALDLTPADLHDVRCSLGRNLGDALVNAGRGAEAPEVYLAAAEVAAPQQASDLQVRAGSELLRSGRVEEGIEVLRRPLETAGITLARSKARAAASLLLQRGYSRLRGLTFKTRDAAQIAPETLVQIDACHAAAAGLAMVDPLRGAYVQTKHLMTALREGDPFRIGRALTYEGGFLCIGGASSRARVDKILQTVHEISEQIDEPYLDALHHTHVALAAYQCGEWESTRDHACTAEAIYRDKCTGSAWELSSTQLYTLWSLYWLGEFKELTTRARASRRDAKARGDLYATVCLNIGLPSFSGLVVDDVTGARQRAQAAARQWTHDDYHLQHFWTAVALSQCDLYEGKAVEASDRIEAQWPLLKRAFLLKILMVRAETLHLRARCALAAAIVSDDRQRFVRLASKLERELRKQKVPWCIPSADLLRAGLLAISGQSDEAIALLKQAELALRALNTNALATVAQRRRGELVGGAAGDELVAAADAWLKEQAVVNVERMTEFLAPGFPPLRAE